jgi:hypothetical protein
MTRNPRKILAVILLTFGVLALGFALVYGKFKYTTKTHEANLGPLEISVNEKRTVYVPLWVGIGSMVIGGVMLLYKHKDIS